MSLTYRNLDIKPLVEYMRRAKLQSISFTIVEEGKQIEMTILRVDEIKR